MIYEFRHKNNSDNRIFLDAANKTKAQQKLRGMSTLRGYKVSDYEERTYERVSQSKNHSRSE